MYTPDFWCILKITGDDPHYRVFGSWAGGYTYGGSWRMNSGIVRIEEDEEYFRFYGASGSCYLCHKTAYGCHYESLGTLNDYIERSNGKISLMDENTDWGTIDWIIG